VDEESVNEEASVNDEQSEDLDSSEDDDFEDEPASPPTVEATPTPTESPPVTATQTPLPDASGPPNETTVPQRSRIQKAVIRLWAATFRVPEDKNPCLMDPMLQRDHEEAMQKQKRKIEKYERLISENERLDTLASETSPEFVALEGSEFKNGDLTLRFLDGLSKETRNSLGKYKSLANGVMSYDDGGYCWEAKKGKSTQMSLVCAGENKLLGVREVRSCEYEAVLATVAVCSADDIARLSNLTIPALKQIAESIELSTE
jgi:hypothetical protein